jgi:hypothetical protein
MKIIVLYDSVFGNTKEVAQKIAKQINCIEKTCKKAGAQIVDSKGFYVEDKEGPLVKTIDDDIKNWLRDNLK